MMRYAQFFIILMIVFGVCISAPDAEDHIPSLHETALLDMVNHARQEKGLELLSFHPNLYASASSHNLDMIEKKYYSSTNPDGKTVQERMLENGYIPVISGEALGMLSFRNFVNPDDAINAIFDNLLKDESDADTAQPLRILNPDARDIGISFRAGTFERDGVVENVYIMVCDVGSNDTSVLEAELLKMINDARKNPRKAFEDLKIDISDVQKSLGFYSWILDSELNPLTNNEKLREAARTHNQDMIQRFYFDNVSPDGKEPLDRVLDAAYQAVYVNETLLALGFEDFFDPYDAVRLFYRQLIRNESDSYERHKGIFDTGVSDIGMNFDNIKLDMGNGKQMNVYLLTINMASATGIFSGGSATQNFDKVYIYLNH